MRINQYLASFVLLHALVAWPGEGTDVDPAYLTLHATEKKPWSMRISVPVGSDFFIKTSNDTGVLDDVKANPDDPTAFGNTAKRIPKKKKIKTKYHVVAQMDWTASGADDTTIGGRGFWVGKGSDTSVHVNELEKYIVKPRDWPTGDITLWLGPDYSYVEPKNECDTLNADWLR